MPADFVWNEEEYELIFKSEGGPIGQDLGRRAEIVTLSARRRAPAPVRPDIRWERGRDDNSPYVDIVVRSRLGLMTEFGTRPHIIRSHGPYPLRNRRTGQVFGPVVHHPGTQPRPFLRPALDDGAL
jgi:hypothetical protein